MSELQAPSVVSSVWPRIGGPGSTGPYPIGNQQTTLPVVNNSNLPQGLGPNLGSLPPPSFPSLQQGFNPPTGVVPYNYALANNLPGPNAMANQIRTMQTDANQRRLMQLEDENAQRRTTTASLQQMGMQILEGQMSVQDQVLQYQLMLEQCMETLDHQNFVLNGQAEELALLRAKMRNFDYLVDAMKQRRDPHSQSLEMPRESSSMHLPSFLSRNPMSSSPGGVSRVTSAKFQPLNLRYRSPTNENSTPFSFNEPRPAPPSKFNRNSTANNQR